MMNDGGNGLHDSLSQLSLDNESPPLQPRHLASAAPPTPRTATTQVFAQAHPLRTPPTSAATATNLSPQHPQSLKRGSISDLDDSWAAEMDLEEIVASHRKKARDGTPVTTAARPEPVALPISAQQSFSYDFSESSDSDQWLTDAEKESSFHEKFHFITQRKLTAHRKFFLQNKIRSANKQTTKMTPESKASPRNIVSTDHDFDDELSFLSPSKTAPTVKLLSQNAEIEAAIHKLFEINRDFVDQAGATAQISLSQSSTSSSTSSVLSSSQSRRLLRLRRRLLQHLHQHRFRHSIIIVNIALMLQPRRLRPDVSTAKFHSKLFTHFLQIVVRDLIDDLVIVYFV